MLCVISLSASCSFDRDYDFKNIELVIGFVVAMTRTIIPQRNHALRFDRRTLPIDYTALAKSAKIHSPYGDTRFHRWWLHRLPRNYLGHASVPKSVARLSTSNQWENCPVRPTQSVLRVDENCQQNLPAVPAWSLLLFGFAIWKHEKIVDLSAFCKLWIASLSCRVFIAQNDNAQQNFCNISIRGVCVE